jgi:AcrR family transcriptional regulator
MPRPAKVRPEEHGRARIEEAALELFGERGYDATSIADIGRRAEITKSVLYHYFTSKAELYAAVCESETAGLVEAVRKAVPDDPSEPRLRTGVEAYFEFLSERRATWRLLLRDRPAEPKLAKLHERLASERAESLVELLAAPAKSAARPVHLSLMTVAIRAFATWWYEHPDVPPEAVTDAVIRFAEAAGSLADDPGHARASEGRWTDDSLAPPPHPANRRPNSPARRALRFRRSRRGSSRS